VADTQYNTYEDTINRFETRIESLMENQRKTDENLSKLMKTLQTTTIFPSASTQPKLSQHSDSTPNDLQYQTDISKTDKDVTPISMSPLKVSAEPTNKRNISAPRNLNRTTSTPTERNYNEETLLNSFCLLYQKPVNGSHSQEQENMTTINL
jgi:hypothetical protein